MKFYVLMYLDTFNASDANRRSLLARLEGWRPYTSPFVQFKEFYSTVDEARLAAPNQTCSDEDLAALYGIAVDEAAVRAKVEAELEAAAASVGIPKFRALFQVGGQPIGKVEMP